MANPKATPQPTTGATNRAAVLFAAILAFALAPFVTQSFTGWDPSAFPIRIERHPIQPAGYTFSIWGLIYLWMLIHGAFGLFKRAEDPLWDAPRTGLTLAAMIGAAWLVIASLSPIWAMLTIWPMAGGALAGYLRADTSHDRWLLSAPIAVLAGWLTCAASVATGIVLAGHGVLNPIPAALAMLGLVLLIAIPVQRRHPAMPLYGLTVIWALVGIIIANLGTTRPIAIAAAIGIAVMAAALLLPRRA
jgi:hypothetical protein